MTQYEIFLLLLRESYVFNSTVKWGEYGHISQKFFSRFRSITQVHTIKLLFRVHQVHTIKLLFRVQLCMIELISVLRINF